ncbi:MAG: YafY family protein [Chloroflexota bacterium]
MLTVLELLQARGQMRASELAEILEVDVRSIRRYVATLQSLGIPVEGERGRYGGYRLSPGYRLPPLMFSDDEALAVTLGLLAARDLGLAAAAPAVDVALGKVTRVLPRSIGQQVSEASRVLELDVPPARASADLGVLRTFAAGASRRESVQIRYESQGAVTDRMVDPYGLVYREGAWYAVAWCHLRQAERVFRLDRVLRSLPTTQTFVRPEDVDCREIVQRALAQTPRAWTVELLLHTSMAEARAWLSPIAGTLEPAESGVLLRSQSSDLRWAACYVLALPWPVRVIGPAELAEELRAASARGLDIAADSAVLVPHRQ